MSEFRIKAAQAANFLKRRPSDSLQGRVAICKAIVQSEAARLPSGAPNIHLNPNDILPVRQYGTGLKALWDAKDKKVSSKYSADKHYSGARAEVQQALKGSKASKAFGYGNCGEQADYVYLKLYKHGIFPIEYVIVDTVAPPFGNHVGIAVGLSAAPHGVKQTLGDLVQDHDAVICDPWIMMLLRDNYNDQTDGVYTVAEYLYYTHVANKIFTDLRITRRNRLTAA